MNDQLADGIEMRRSKRVLLRVAIQVRWTPAGDSAITEDTTTLVVNAHGALISLAMKVKPGARIFVRNRAIVEETRNAAWFGFRKSTREKAKSEWSSCGPMQSSGGWNSRRTTGSNAISRTRCPIQIQEIFFSVTAISLAVPA